MEDGDDDFGDLYTDVLLPFSSLSSASASVSSQPPPPPQPISSHPRPLNLNNLHSSGDEDDVFLLGGAPDPKSSFPSQTPPVLLPDSFKGSDQQQPIAAAAPPLIRDDEELKEEDKVARVSPNKVEFVTRVPKYPDAKSVLPNEDLGVSESLMNPKVVVSPRRIIGGEDTNDKDGDLLGQQVQPEVTAFASRKDNNMETDDLLDAEPVIPGLSSAGPFDFDHGEDDSKRGDDASAGGGDWDSDSDDDIQIVLNDNSGGPPGGVDRMDNEDQDGDDDLVIVTDGDHQPAEQNELGEDSAQLTDSERKEIGFDASKPNGVMGVNASGGRPSYMNHGYHPHHSQFKYVRTGAPAVPGGAVIGPGGGRGQVRPPFNPIAGSGRGDWRPVGVKTAPTMQKGFQSGFGFPAWGNNSSGSGFGRGLEFTLPSHKTVFDIDIEGFEEKPWRHPGVDTSDFFNFGLNEDSWKDYCKQLGQLRLEATMQSKIRVYESGRSEQDYDPDLPPELAAATGFHDFSVGNAHLAKTDGSQGDLTVQGRGTVHVRPQIPTGRAIQVEGGYGERLPSADSRPPRNRDSDAIIEIVLQHSIDDDCITPSSNPEGPDNELQQMDNRGEQEAEEDILLPGNDNVPHNSLKEMQGRQDPLTGSVHSNSHEGDDGDLPYPPEAAFGYHPTSKGRNFIYPAANFATPHDGRQPQGTSHDRYNPVNTDYGSAVIPSQNARNDRPVDKEDKLDGGTRLTSRTSPSGQNDSARVSIEHKYSELPLADSSVALVGEEMVVDSVYPSDATGDGTVVHSVKKQKISSEVEQPPMQDTDGGNDARNKPMKSDGSRDYKKGLDDGEEEVAQDEHNKRMGNMRRQYDEDHAFQRQGDCDQDVRQEVDRSFIAIQGREDSYYSHRDWDSNSAHQSHSMTRDIEMLREGSAEVWLRRDGDTHGRRLDEDARKRDRADEIGSRQGRKARESESIDRDEHLQSRKRLDNGEWRSRHDKVVGQRQRERDDIVMNRHDNLNDRHLKRRKDDEHRCREPSNKEVLLDFRIREGTNRRKRERDDCLDLRREDQSRVRDKPDDPPLTRHRDESWLQRERDDRQRHKHPHDDTLSNRERDEGRGALRSARGTDEKPLIGNARAKDELKSSGFDKDYQLKDKRRHTEQSKRRDRQVDSTQSHHRGHEDVYTREIRGKNEERNPRYEKSRTNNDHLVDHNQWLHKDRQKESSRSKECVGDDQNTTAPSKRKQDESSVHRNLKVSSKGKSELESGNEQLTSGPIDPRDPGQSRSSSSGIVSKRSRENEGQLLQQHHSARNHHKDSCSDDDQQNSSRRGRSEFEGDQQNSSRRGRSELEGSTSHKERSRSSNSARSLSLLPKTKESSKRNNERSIASKRSEEMVKTLIVEAISDNQHQLMHETASDKEITDGEHDTGPSPTMLPGSNHSSRDMESDKNEEDDQHHHLDTVAKLKKRSERFKLPMPSEKDPTGNRRVETSETGKDNSTVDAEIKHERPARKRRWISSS